jgi:tRNA-dihydrouridine synthase B
MIDMKALSLLDRRTRHMLSTSPDDRPLGVQLLANDGKDTVRALKALESLEYDLLDFNAACPTPKVVRKGKGASLLKEPHKLKEILEILVSFSKTPVTVKIRSGWDIDSVNAREIALYAEDAGVSALFIHGRTKMQGYSGNVDYKAIKEVKDALKIPVIASGDNLDVSRIKKMFDNTGCDGVVVARGSFGNPWIFQDLIRFFQNGVIGVAPCASARVEIMKHHLDLLVRHYGEQRGLSVFHKFFIWYTRGIRKTRTLRDKAFRTERMEEIFALIDEFRLLDENRKQPPFIKDE